MSLRDTIAANARCGARLGIRIATAAFVVDAAVLAAGAFRRGTEPPLAALGVLLGAGAYGVVAVALGALFALGAVYVGGGREIGPAALSGVSHLRRLLGATDGAACRSFAARLVAALLALAAAVAAAVPCALAATEDIRTPLYTVAIACAISLGAIAASAAAWPVWMRTGTLLSRIAPRLPRPAIQLGILTGAGAVAGASVVAATWSSAGFALPWRGPIFALALLAVGIAWFAFDPGRRRARPLLRRALLGARVLLPIAGLASGALLPRPLSSVNDLLADATGPIAGIHGLAERLLDFDRDGYLSILGQGDCAPRDRTRHPAARDVPNDGIDQNCSGEDRRNAIHMSRARHDYPATPRPAAMPIVLVTVDSVSAPDLDLYGAKRRTMPALARWAESAVVFERAFAVGPSTRLAVPSIVTGRYMSSMRHKPKPQTHGAWAKGNTTIAEILSRHGYATIAVVGDSYFSKTLRWVYQGFGKQLLDWKGPDGLTAPAVTNAALGALREAGGADRVFLWAHYADAHLSGSGYAPPPDMTPFPGGEPKDEHDTKLLYIDGQIDRLFAGIAEIYGDRPRLVIVSADHGEAFDESHVKKAKARHAWDLSTAVTHIPLVVSSPYGGPRRTTRLASNIDIVPTILNAVGITAKGIEGDSLVPTLLTGADPGRPILQQMFYPEYIARGKPPLSRVAVRVGTHVLYRHHAGFHLFDYVRDPGEGRNLSASDPSRVEDLADTMQAMLAGSPWADPQPR